MTQRALAVALAVVLTGFALYHLLARPGKSTPGRTVVRITHTQLEPGVRDAIDALARGFEKLHSEVRFEQNPIPERAYAAYLRTQLTGGTPPDIIGLRPFVTDELCAQFLLPLTPATAQENPYNNGTALQGVPWRNTFIENLTTFPAYRKEMQEVYAIPLSAHTVRLYVNLDLWRRLLGSTPLPETTEALVAACSRIASCDRSKYIPVASSRYNAPLLLGRLFESATNRAAQGLDTEGLLRIDNRRRALAWLRSGDGLDSGDLRAALEESRAVARHFQPGFMQLDRHDASFAFLQERAVMIASGLWDAGGLRQQAQFPIGVIPLPPSGVAGSLGPSSELGVGLTTLFAIARASPHHELALEFLRYASSAAGNAEFVRVAGWLPAIVGVDPRPDAREFTPVTSGYPPGLDFEWSNTGPNTHRLHRVHSHLLFSPRGSVDAYLAAMRTGLTAAVAADLEKHGRDQRLNSARLDLAIAARLRLGSGGDDVRLAGLLENQILSDTLAARLAIERRQSAMLGTEDPDRRFAGNRPGSQ